MSGRDHTTVCRLRVLDILHLLVDLLLASDIVDIVVGLLFTHLDLDTPDNNALNLSRQPNRHVSIVENYQLDPYILTDQRRQSLAKLLRFLRFFPRIFLYIRRQRRVHLSNASLVTQHLLKRN